MKKILNKFNEALKTLKNKDNYRIEEGYLQNTIFFSSNDYLGLNNSNKVKKSGITALKKYGAGASASKFISGYHIFYDEIRLEIIKNKKIDDCVIFNSGYTANLGLFSSLFTKNDIIFLDENSHASSFEGAALSGAKIMRFNHNSPGDLENKLQKFKTTGSIGIATETVFSMQGTKLENVEKYFELAKKYDAILITDEAHSFGIFDFNFPKYDLHVQMGTFSKSVGVLGGYVAGNAILIDFIRQFSKTGIYTTALPPSILASVLTSIKMIFSGEVTGKKALKSADFFIKTMQKTIKTFKNNSKSHIVFIEFKTNEQALNAAKELQDNGFFIKAIRSPTVKIPGIRISFCNFHTTDDVKNLSSALSKILITQKVF